MGNSFWFGWEVVLMTAIQSVLPESMVKVLSFCSALGEEMIMVAIFAFIYFCWNKEMGIYVGTNLMVNLTFNPLIKNLFLRRRPYFDHKSIRILKPVDAEADIYDISAQGYSFPSGHSSNSATFYGSCAAYLKKRWVAIAAVIVCFLVGISRFSLGAHYPTDVFVGWAMGIAIILIVGYLQEKVERKWILYLLLLLVSAPGWFYCKSNDYFTGFGMMLGFFAGTLVEQKYVRFTVSRTWYRILLRLVCGMGLFLALNTMMKLPFSRELLESASMTQYILRAGRYAVCIFIITAIYPMSFRILDRRDPAAILF